MYSIHFLINPVNQTQLPTSPAECHQLLPGHVVERDLVLEELRELDDVLVGRANLQLLHRSVKLHKVTRRLGGAARLRFSFGGVMRFHARMLNDFKSAEIRRSAKRIVHVCEKFGPALA